MSFMPSAHKHSGARFRKAKVCRSSQIQYRKAQFRPTLKLDISNLNTDFEKKIVANCVKKKN